jgi:hypothetical protein
MLGVIIDDFIIVLFVFVFVCVCVCVFCVCRSYAHVRMCLELMSVYGRWHGRNPDYNLASLA